MVNLWYVGYLLNVTAIQYTLNNMFPQIYIFVMYNFN